MPWKSHNSGSLPLRAWTNWLIYAAAWVPYAASYVVVFLATGTPSARGAVANALYNVMPAALWGAGVVYVCRSFPWSPRRRVWFFAAHCGLATLYAALWVGSVSLLFTVVESVEHWALTVDYLRSYALQWTFFSGLMIYGTIASFSYTIQVVERLREEEARAARLEALRARAVMEALRAQLNPHFLFNTLHSLMVLVRCDSRAAEDALEQLAGLLRYVLNAGPDPGEPCCATDDVRFEDELAFVETYLALERLRLGERLKVERHVDPETLDCYIPALTVQPLVENAIKHAVAPRAEGGTVTIRADVEADGGLRIEVRDDGPGADPLAVDEAGGIGLRVVRQRLEARYRGGAGFEITTAPGAGFAVVVRAPAAIPSASPVETTQEVTAWRFVH